MYLLRSVGVERLRWPALRFPGLLDAVPAAADAEDVGHQVGLAVTAPAGPSNAAAGAAPRERQAFQRTRSAAVAKPGP